MKFEDARFKFGNGRMRCHALDRMAQFGQRVDQALGQGACVFSKDRHLTTDRKKCWMIGKRADGFLQGR